MEWVVTTAATIDAAKELALDELGVDAKEAEFETVQEPSKGFVGIGVKPAKVRARITPRAQASKQSARPRRRRSSSKDGDNRGQKQGRQNKSGQSDRTSSKSSRSNSGSGQSSQKSNASKSSSSSSRSDSAGNRSSQKPRGGSNSKSGQKKSSKSDNSRDQQRSPNAEEARVEDPMSLEEQGTLAQEFLAGFLDEMDLRASLGVRDIDEDNLEITVDGDDLGLLIGPRGQTLQALQEITKTVLQRKAINGAQGRISVDVASYKQRRRDALVDFTTRQADRVLETGNDCALEPMVSADRKIVHDAVNDIDGVETISEGTDPRRRVVIVPA